MQAATQPSSSPSPRFYIASAILCAAALLLPFLLVEIPPVTDLPQQTAQIRLLFEALEDGGQGSIQNYRVQALDPNKLGYLPLLVTWLLFPPLAAGRLAVAGIGLLWVLSIHALAYANNRSPAAAAAAALLFFNHTMYWGLLNFLLGLPLFCLFWWRIQRLPQAEVSRWRLLQLSLFLLLLYSAHVLWLAAASGFLLLTALVQRWNPRVLAARLATAAPAWALVAWWYPRFHAAGFVSETTWGRNPLERLHPGWLLNSAFGGLTGKVEALVALALVLWLGIGVGQSWLKRSHKTVANFSRPEPRNFIDRRLLATAALFLVPAFILPNVMQHTIFFASRWLPVAAVFLVLALPPPRLRPWLSTAVPTLLWASLMTATVTAWTGFEHQELDGLRPALAVTSKDSLVLGLDLVRTSEHIQGFPFYHLYAWNQALNGGELARSFANEASSLVVFSDLPRPTPWTDGLDWRARQVRRSDIPHFDFVFVHGDARTHALFLADERLEPSSPAARWRLYRVRDAPRRVRDAPPTTDGYTSSPSR
jgi:hypothetical protein